MLEVTENGKVVQKQTRWRSPILWTAIIVQVFLLLDTVGFWQPTGIDRNLAQKLVDTVLQLLVIVGVLNDPTSANRW